MKKDFDKWNELKKAINARADTAKLFFNEREIWWCRLGANVGSEQDGVGEDFSRPVVIIRQFNLDVALVVPLTSRTKRGKYYVPIGKVEEKSAMAIISQVRLIDKKRFDEKIGMVSAEKFEAIVNTIVEVDFRKAIKSSPPQKRGRGRSHL